MQKLKSNETLIYEERDDFYSNLTRSKCRIINSHFGGMFSEMLVQEFDSRQDEWVTMEQGSKIYCEVMNDALYLSTESYSSGYPKKDRVKEIPVIQGYNIGP